MEVTTGLTLILIYQRLVVAGIKLETQNLEVTEAETTATNYGADTFTSRNPTVRSTNSETPTSQRNSKTPTSLRNSETPTSQGNSETPTSQRNSETPTSQRNSKTQTSQRNSETPTSQRNSETPTSQRNSETPTSQRNSETPTSQQNSETPTSQRNSETPTSQRNSETPTSQRNSETPTSQRNSETPTSQRNSETPTSQRNSETPTSQRNSETPTSQQNSETPTSQRNIVDKQEPRDSFPLKTTNMLSSSRYVTSVVAPHIEPLYYNESVDGKVTTHTLIPVTSKLESNKGRNPALDYKLLFVEPTESVRYLKNRSYVEITTQKYIKTEKKSSTVDPLYTLKKVLKQEVIGGNIITNRTSPLNHSRRFRELTKRRKYSMNFVKGDNSSYVVDEINIEPFKSKNLDLRQHYNISMKEKNSYRNQFYYSEVSNGNMETDGLNMPNTNTSFHENSTRYQQILYTTTIQPEKKLNDNTFHLTAASLHPYTEEDTQIKQTSVRNELGTTKGISFVSEPTTILTVNGYAPENRTTISKPIQTLSNTNSNFTKSTLPPNPFFSTPSTRPFAPSKRKLQSTAPSVPSLAKSFPISDPWPVKLAAEIPGDLILGGLMMVHEREDSITCGPIMPQGGIQALETMLYTLDVINSVPGTPFTIGAHILDDCDKDTYGLEMAVDFIKGSISNIDDAEYHCNKTQIRKVISGVVGAASSVTSIQVANLLRLFKIPQVSFFSTSPELSNKQRFEYFTRTIPSDHHQVKAMVEIVRRLGWSYVSIIYEESNYGIKAFEELEDLLAKYEICIAVKEKLVKDSGVAEETAYDNIVYRLLTKPRARGAIIFGSDQEVAGLMRAVRRCNATGSFTWIGSDGWSARSLVWQGSEAEVEGTLSVQPQANPVQGFDLYFLNLTVENNRRNPWFVEFWEHHFQCRYPNSPRTPYNQRHRRNCTGQEQLTAENTVFENQLQFVSDAVMAFAVALRDMHSELCLGKPGLCEHMRPAKGPDLLKYLRKVNFEGLSGDKFRFDANGDGPARYNIIHFKQTRRGSYQWLKVGEYIEGELTLNMSGILTDAPDEQRKWQQHLLAQEEISSRQWFPINCGRLPKEETLPDSDIFKHH